MQKNIGSKDKNLRLGAGVVLLILGILLKGAWVLSIIGIILLVTAFMGYCPAYQVMNADTLNDKFNKHS